MRRRLAVAAAGDDGFTLVELVIAGAVLLVITFAVMSILDRGVRHETGQQVRSEALDDTRKAMERLSKEVRQALWICPQILPAGVVCGGASAPNRLEMTTLINGSAHRVVYSVTGTTLQRSAQPCTTAADQCGPSTVFRPIVTGLADPNVFVYDPSPWTLVPDLVTLRFSVKPQRLQGNRIVFSQDVQLRNAPLL